MRKTGGTFAAALVAATLAVGALGPATASANYAVPYGAEALAQGAWNEAWAPEALVGGNKSSCKPSSTHPYPVVLVHATLADEGSNWVTLRRCSRTKATASTRSITVKRGLVAGDPFFTGASTRSADRTLCGRTLRIRQQGPLENESQQGRPRRPLAGRDDAGLLHQVPGRRREGQRADRACTE